MTIDRFTGQYAFLSNFSPASVVLDGVEYTTTEHAYQAAKTFVSAERRGIALASFPGSAKKMGRAVTLRADWEAVKVDVMRGLLIQKFAPGRPNAWALLDTGDAWLVEGNTWDDTFWGVCRGKGENHLGRLLMQQRDFLRGWRAIGGAV